tara:strand:+ start:187 stop:438 length:252 start_codon:yes stop_codon:yes gene_type:complete
MIEIQIEKLQKFKTKNIKLPAYLVGDFNPEFNIIRNDYIQKHHLDFYKEVIELWRHLAGETLDRGHSEKLDSYKNALGSLIYI